MLQSLRRDELSERERGFTLVELVVAMLIIGIVMVSLITVQVRTLQTNSETQARATATALANAAMEEFRTVPWNVLKKGLANNFLTASGGDPFVSANQLVVDTVATDLVIAPSGGSGQNLAKPWAPLFDSTGSHRQQVADPEGKGTTYWVSAYVTRSKAAANYGAVGLAVLVEWQRPGATKSHTVIYSSAYAPSQGCGDLDTAPFLASCQPTYRGNASSGSLTTTVSASQYDVATGTVGDPVVVLGATDLASVTTASSRTRADVDSAQSTVATATVEYGVSSITTFSGSTPTIVGGATRVAAASNNSADPGAPAAHQASNGTAGITSNTTQTGTETLNASGDRGRTGYVVASTNNTCTRATGAALPANQPCSSAYTTATWTVASTPRALWTFNTHQLNFMLAYQQPAAQSGSWAARFRLGGTVGSATQGCTVLTGAGCVSAGASTALPRFRVGQFNSGTGQWDSDEAPQGLVYVVDYTDSFLAQRGASQTGAPSVTRTGTLYYWNGTDYSSISLSPATETATSPILADEVTFTSDPAYLITATAEVSITPSSTATSGTNCAVERCRAQVDAGLIAITLHVVVQPASGSPYVIDAVTLVNGSTGLAQFLEPVDA